MKMKINGKIRDVVTISELAKMCGKSTATMRKAEERGILPRANMRTNHVATAKGVQPGYRLYTIELAEEVAEIFRSQISQGTETSEVVKQQLRDLFTKERTENNL